eukprot:m.34917 g.34917  ORF g.34917 m.34917 type:complete len:671 (-) comp7386_c0_seq1:236-2248(-)
MTLRFWEQRNVLSTTLLLLVFHGGLFQLCTGNQIYAPVQQRKVTPLCDWVSSRLPDPSNLDPVNTENVTLCPSTSRWCSPDWICEVNAAWALQDGTVSPLWNYTYSEANWSADGFHVHSYDWASVYSDIAESRFGGILAGPMLDHLAQHHPLSTVDNPKEAAWVKLQLKPFLVQTMWVNSQTSDNFTGSGMVCTPANEKRWDFTRPTWVDAATKKCKIRNRRTVDTSQRLLPIPDSACRNLMPLIKDVCTHTVAFDIPQDCNATNGVLTLLKERRAEGNLPKTLRADLEASFAAAQSQVINGSLPALQCDPTIRLPRAARNPFYVGPSSASHGRPNVLCTFLMSYHGLKLGTLRVSDDFALQKDLRTGSEFFTKERARSVSSAMYTGAAPRVAAAWRTAIRSIGPTILVTHGGDFMPWDDILKSGPHIYKITSASYQPTKTMMDIAEERAPEAVSLLRMPELVAWYSNNAVLKHPKLHALPIGVKCSQLETLVSTILSRPDDSGLNQQRRFKLLVNFNLSTFPCTHTKFRRGGFCTRPLIVVTAAQRWPFATVLPPALLERLVPTQRLPQLFRDLLTAFRFVLSPPGFGWDCFRTYEALLAGTIPIVVRTNTPSDRLFDDLPVLLVDSYDEITEELLDQTWTAFQNRRFDFQKLQASHWGNKIRSLSDVR